MKKSIFAILIALLLTTLLCAQAFAAEAEFVPVLRFIACSDSHVRSDSNTNCIRIGKMLEQAYGDAALNKAHPALDALLMAGDLTNDGTKEEFDLFWDTVSGSLKDETQFLGVVAKNHDGYVMKRAELREYFTELTGLDADFHKVVCGYHFIGVSASPKDGIHYSREQLNWLKDQLDAAVKEDPNRPVFVTHHEHNRNTVYGSSTYDGWGVTYFNQLLKKYPQVVDFSGHSHYPLNDPRSVWQGKFTAIGTGAIYYSEFTIDEFRAYHPADSNDTATYWIVEVDAANRIRLRGMDIEANEMLCEYVLDNPADPNNRDLTPEKQKARSKAPVFGADAALEVCAAQGCCTVTAPPAESTDGMPVALYRLYVKNGMGITVDKQWVLPQYYRADGDLSAAFSVEGLSTGDYTFCVVAETAYGVQSVALEAKTHIDGDNAFKGVINYIARIFQRFVSLLKNVFH